MIKRKRRISSMLGQEKGQINMPFSWIFAIIVGAIILFLALYGATKVINTGQQATTAQTGKEIGILLNPLETGFGSESISSLSLPVETRISNTCDSFGNFGFQGITLYQKSFGKWSKTNIESSFENKYIFSEENVEGKRFIIFSKSFEFPFKVSDLIYMTSSDKNYCFVNSPDEIEDELSALQPENFFFEECPSGGTEICFNGGDCDINVNTRYETVEKRGDTVWYEGNDALMYASIFSDKDVYECQIKRLMKRIRELAFIYDNKQTNLLSQECSSEVNVLSLANAVEGVSSSEDLTFAERTAQDIESQNNNAECRLW